MSKPSRIARLSIYPVVFLLIMFSVTENSVTSAMREPEKPPGGVPRKLESMAPDGNRAILRGRVFRVQTESISSIRRVFVKLVCNSKPEALWTVSDGRGFFFFGDLPIGDTCVATPQRVGYHFAPSSIQFLVFQSFIQGVDFNPVRDPSLIVPAKLN